MKKLLAKALKKLLAKKQPATTANRIGTGWKLSEIRMLPDGADNSPVIGWTFHGPGHRNCITLLKYQDRYRQMCIARLN